MGQCGCTHAMGHCSSTGAILLTQWRWWLYPYHTGVPMGYCVSTHSMLVYVWLYWCHTIDPMVLVALPVPCWRPMVLTAPSLAGLSPTLAIHVYTPREVYGTVGSHVTLSCSFWSSEWISEDISITWHFQAEGSRDSISIFHYAKGQPYIDDVGTFKERMEWVGNPRRKDGSIVIHNLDYTDNGTFTCDVKNPPDIVGKSSQVTLYVLEKGSGSLRHVGSGSWIQSGGREKSQRIEWGATQREEIAVRGRGEPPVSPPPPNGTDPREPQSVMTQCEMSSGGETPVSGTGATPSARRPDGGNKGLHEPPPGLQ
uniref:Myelin protein zero n=1 Tax=Coturnix japonica TaxID=93934 RepID=A0A8C2ST49_COTJA